MPGAPLGPADAPPSTDASSVVDSRGLPRFLPDRLVLGGLLLLTCAAFDTTALDPVNVVKASILLSGAAVLLGLALARALRTSVLRLPTGAPALTGLALFLALLCATASATHTPTAVWGTYGRGSGLLAYTAGLVAYAAGLRVLRREGAAYVLGGLLFGGLFTALYGLFQYTGHDSIGWANPFNPIIAGLGNPDFASAYLGMAVPAAAWGALWTRWHPVVRLLSAAALAFMLVTAALSAAVQGPLAAAAGLLIVVLGWSLEQGPVLRRRLVRSLTGLVAGGAAVLLLGVLGAGPAHPFFSGVSWDARTWYWRGALDMFGSAPLWGVGLSNYGINWWAHRPLDALATGGYADAAHSVPLQMLAEGGLLLAVAYLAFVGLVAVRLVQGLRRLQGEQRLLLAGAGGAWVAYQTQAAVSIDQVPLLVVHFTLAAAVLCAAESAPLRTVRLPGLPRVAAGAGQAVVAAAVAVGLYAAFAPEVASRAAFTAEVSPGGDSVTPLKRALDLQPHVIQYWQRLGETWSSLGVPTDALATYREALQHDDTDIAADVRAGSLAEEQGDLPLARRALRRAAALSPYDSGVVSGLVGFEVRHGGAAGAVKTAEQFLSVLPGDPSVLSGLGDARAALGDRTGARDAYRRALTSSPGLASAVAGLQRVS